MSTMIEQMLHIYFKKSAKLEITKRELCAYFILNFRLKEIAICIHSSARNLPIGQK